MLYPEAGHNGDTLRVIAQEWAAVLEEQEAAESEFLAAMRVLKRRCKFFPTPADLYEALVWVREHPPSAQYPLLPEPGPSPERLARTRQACRIISAQLTGQMSASEASKRLDALFAGSGRMA